MVSPKSIAKINGEREIPSRQKNCPRVKCPGFNFARGSESPFVHYTQPYRRAGNPPSSLHSDFVVVCQPLWCTTLSLAASLVSPYGLGTREHSSRYHGFACQPLRGLVTSRNGELSKRAKKKKKIRNMYLLLFFMVQ